MSIRDVISDARYFVRGKWLDTLDWVIDRYRRWFYRDDEEG